MDNISTAQKLYKEYTQRIQEARQTVQRPLTLTEKILYAHLYDASTKKAFVRGEDYANFQPDRVAMQDATAQMALLQFVNSGMKRVQVPSSVHCDHLIQAETNGEADTKKAIENNSEVYDFLQSVSDKYGIGFWKPGSGIIHQVVLENYAFPGGLIIGTDSHTPNAGGMGMLAIGVGGADAVDVMAGMGWELKFPKVIGVKLTGKLSSWVAPKDVILHLAGLLTVKGGTGYVVEYFGEGADSISATGKATICNMGAEIGATTSLFSVDNSTLEYLKMTDRSEIVSDIEAIQADLRPDREVVEAPEEYYDKVIHIDLASLEPYLNGPFTPDKAWRVSDFKQAVVEHDYPHQLKVGLVGSCTNSSYEDLSKVMSLIKQMKKKDLQLNSKFILTPGSSKISETLKQEGVLKELADLGVTVMANACGPCIGQWKRSDIKDEEKNAIVTSFNRNFAKRNDGNPNTYAFVSSPEMVAALAIAGNITFNPLTDKLRNNKGEDVMLEPPVSQVFPENGFAKEDGGYQEPSANGEQIEIKVKPDSKRLQLLSPFDKWDGKNLTGLNLLIKAKGKCTTDHISMAGPWLRYRGHLDNISDNLLIGAVNFFNEEINSVRNNITGVYDTVPNTARAYKKENIGSVVVADENYGEGSSREHAAMEPRHLNVKLVIARSFARIHETNLKKQGVLALTFANVQDYDKIKETDTFSIEGMEHFTPESKLTLHVTHEDGSVDQIETNHTYNENQWEWYKAGSALNYIKKNLQST